MNYRYAVWRNTFLCYDQKGEVRAYLHELPLEILSIKQRGKKVIFTGRYMWPGIPPEMTVFLRASGKKIYPETVKKDKAGTLFTYTWNITEKPVKFRAFLEYSYMTAVIPVRLSKTVKKNIRTGVSISEDRLVLWSRSLLKSLKNHIPSALIRR